MKTTKTEQQEAKTMLRIFITKAELQALKENAKSDERTLTAYVRRLIREAGGFKAQI